MVPSLFMLFVEEEVRFCAQRKARRYRDVALMRRVEAAVKGNSRELTGGLERLRPS